MASAVCTTDVRLMFITYEQLEQLYFQNPEFGLYLVRLIMQRFEMDVKEFAPPWGGRTELRKRRTS